MSTVTIELKDITCTSDMPILDYCRFLIKERVDPATILDVYMGDVMAIRVHGIGNGAKLRVSNNNQGTPIFKRYKPTEEGLEAPTCVETRETYVDSLAA